MSVRAEVAPTECTEAAKGLRLIHRNFFPCLTLNFTGCTVLLVEPTRTWGPWTRRPTSWDAPPTSWDAPRRLYQESSKPSGRRVYPPCFTLDAKPVRFSPVSEFPGTDTIDFGPVANPNTCCYLPPESSGISPQSGTRKEKLDSLFGLK
jgi:hypothetical protein